MRLIMETQNIEIEGGSRIDYPVKHMFEKPSYML